MILLAALALVGLGACFAPTANPGASCGPGDECPTTLICNGLNKCQAECASGFVETNGSCIDIDECSVAHDCSADATCANKPGAFTCTCNPGFAGDGRSCDRVCKRVLIYDDCRGPTDADCATISEAQFADNAAMGLSIEVVYSGAGDQAAFRSLFDAGGFDVLVFESSLDPVEVDSATRVASWVDGGGKAIISFWDLDNDTTGKTIRDTTRVTTGTTGFSPPRDVFADPASPVSLFDNIETVVAPLTFTELMGDDGDELTVTDGVIAARHASTTGPGAIAITRDDQVITLGFLPIGLVFQGPRDADADGKPDVQELYTNMLGYLCGY